MRDAIKTDVIVIGAGPVGLFTVFQCGMLKLSTHVVEALDGIGGQCAAMYPEKPIFDIPGFENIPGQDLVDRLARQAAPFAPVYHTGQQVTLLEKDDQTGLWQVETSKGTCLQAPVVVIAAGGGAFGPNRPPLDGLDAYEGKAVHYMVQRRDAFKDKKIVIAGGGDSAVDWAVSLCDVAAKVQVVHRRDRFRAAPESVAQMKALASAGKIELITPYQLHALQGDAAAGILSAVVVKDLDGAEQTLEADALLSFFGLAMDPGPIGQWGLNMEKGYIQVNPATCATNLDGVFAVGDIVTYPGKLKLILCGFSEAAMAAHAAFKVARPDEALHFEHSTTKGVTASV
jgi:thioredoxin reductase (NADPH)